jgi:hypothetical protein
VTRKAGGRAFVERAAPATPQGGALGGHGADESQGSRLFGGSEPPNGNPDI